MTTLIPRCYFELLAKEEGHCSLIGFCDASAGAYAAVVYLRIEGSAGTTVNFVVSKTRVCPVNKQSIPRLELLSTLLLAKPISSVSVALEVDIQLQPHRCFSDSKVALFWIKGITKEWKPWVENRVNEVIERLYLLSVGNTAQGLRTLRTSLQEASYQLNWLTASCGDMDLTG